MKLLLALVASTAIAYPALAQQPAQPRSPFYHAAAPLQPQQQASPILAENLGRDQIRQVQQALMQKGFSPGRVDGVWGSHTEQALSDFQNAQGMEATGHLDQQTLAALNLDASNFAENGNAGKQNMSNTSSHNQSTVGLADRSANENLNLQAFHNATMGVPDAISAVTNDGSKALDVRFGMQDGQPVYFVRTYNPDKKVFWVGMVDGNTGKIIGKGTIVPENELSQDQKNQLTMINKAYWSLDDAVEAAEKDSKGDAVEAWVVQDNGRPTYDVLIDKNGSTQDWKIDPTTGQITSG